MSSEAPKSEAPKSEALKSEVVKSEAPKSEVVKNEVVKNEAVKNEAVKNEVEVVKIPKRIFIVPYRNRVQHKFFFSKYMSFILEDDDDYEIYFSHQCDARTFNRGATKNIGFIAARNKYPNDYKDITFIFNDVDTIPFNKIFDYNTQHGIVKHFYGFKYALGGIVVMKGADFEKTNGFPCFWGWGMEDNALQKRCEAVGLHIDRSVFYNIGSPEILQLFDGISRIISKKDPWRGEHDDGYDGLRTISQMQYTIDEKSENPNDNIFAVHNSKIMYVNIGTFLTHVPFGSEEYYTYDLREPKRKIIHPDKIRETNKSVVTTNDWTNIPYYPTNREKRENVVKYLMSMGKPVPPSLLQQIAQDKQKEVQEDSFNKNAVRQQQPQQQQQAYPSQQQAYPSQQMFRPPPPPNRYSPQYAVYVGAKPRAQASARIGLGGAY